jgi:hypothetical protein
VKAFTTRTQTTVASFFAYETGFQGGVRVAAGDVNGDGAQDLITGAGPGGGPHVKVFSGRTSESIHSFLAYEATFTGGVYVATGDVNGDGFADIIVGPGENVGPHVKIFSGVDGELIHSFFAYVTGFQGGVRVATGDVNGDGAADIITGAGPGGASHVKVFDSTNYEEVASFFAYSPTFSGGVYVAAGDVNGDGFADIITGAGRGAGPHVKVFDGFKRDERASFFAYDAGFSGGVRVASGDVDGDGLAELVTAPGPGAASQVRILDGMTQTESASFLAYGSGYIDGLFVGAAPQVRPVLSIDPDRLRENAIVSWPVGEVGVLEFSTQPGDPRGWMLVTQETSESGDRSQVTLPFSASPSFFRLKGDDEAVPISPQ